MEKPSADCAAAKTSGCRNAPALPAGGRAGGQESAAANAAAAGHAGKAGAAAGAAARPKSLSRRLTDWTVSLANRKAAEYWLYFLTFLESSVFPIPSDVLFIPMVLIKPQKAWRYAFWVSFFSIAGGVLGWAIGHFAYNMIAAPLLEFYGKYEQFEALRGSASADFLLLLLLSSGFFHLPPLKIVTILAGAAGVPLWLFIVSAIVARAGRYYLLAWLLKKYDQAILDFLHRHMRVLCIGGAALCIIAFAAYMYISHL